MYEHLDPAGESRVSILIIFIDEDLEFAWLTCRRAGRDERRGTMTEVRNFAVRETPKNGLAAC